MSFGAYAHSFILGIMTSAQRIGICLVLVDASFSSVAVLIPMLTEQYVKSCYVPYPQQHVALFVFFQSSLFFRFCFGGKVYITKFTILTLSVQSSGMKYIQSGV